MNRTIAFLCLVVICFGFATMAAAVNWGFLFRGAVRYMNEEDLRLLDEAAMKALDHEPEGAIVHWQNPDTEASGQIDVLRAGTIDGNTCKRLQIAQRAGRGKGKMIFTFCKDPQDQWVVVPRKARQRQNRTETTETAETAAPKETVAPEETAAPTATE